MNNAIQYFGEKDDTKPRRETVISDLSNVEISELYVKRHHKKVIYCLKISWSSDESLVDSFVDDASTVDSRFLDGVQDTDDEQSSPVRAVEKSPRFGLSRPKLRRNKTENDIGRHSVDDESLTFGTRRRCRAGSTSNGKRIPRIPELVEVDQVVHENSSSIATTPAGNRRQQLTPYEEDQQQKQERLQAEYLSAKKLSKRKARKKMVTGTKIMAAAGTAVGVTVVTAGIGMVGGLIALGVGAAAGGGGAMADMNWSKTRKCELIIASADYAKACRWKSCLDASLGSTSFANSTWGQLFVSDGRQTRAALVPHSHRSFDTAQEMNNESRRVRLTGLKVRWKPLEGGWTTFLGTGTQGIRIQREERVTIDDRGKEIPGETTDGGPCAPLKSQIVLSTTPLEAFLCLMSSGRLLEDDLIGDISPNSGQRASFRILERIDDHTDVIHLVFRPLYLVPSWTTARDFVLYRTWRLEEDGSYFVCFEDIQHPSCPPTSTHVRGEMHQAFTIAPLKKGSGRRIAGAEECLMTAVVQVDPRGWVPTRPLSFLANQAYAEGFAVAALLQLLDIRDAIDLDRFVAVDDDSFQPRERTQSYEIPPEVGVGLIPAVNSMDDDPMNYDFKYANREKLRILTSATGFASRPIPWEQERWAEPDPDAFRVRGENYLRDRQKVNAGFSIGRLVAVDVVNVEEPIFTGLSTHPTERLQLALKKEKELLAEGKESDLPPFIFAMNIVMPGPPVYHAVFW